MTPLSRRHFLSLSAAAAVTLRAPMAWATADRPTSVLVWTGSGPSFGGFSALELSSDRRRALFLGDRGFIVRAQLIRDAAGRLTGVQEIEHFSLRDTDGAALSGGRTDTEGMDQRTDGTLFIGFEGGRRSRILRYGDERGVPQTLASHPDWRDLPGNHALEALAVDANGAVFTIPEQTGPRGFPLYQLQNGSWSIVAHVPMSDDFAPVGADFGPDGNLYLLERKYRLAFFATRISRLRPGAWAQREVLVETTYGVLDNHEGISITRDAAGQLWATTISDDNQSRFQRTELAEFALPNA